MTWYSSLSMTDQAWIGGMKAQLAAAALRMVASNPAPRPPYHDAITTAGKKKMNGTAVGPIAGVSAARASQPRATQARATL